MSVDTRENRTFHVKPRDVVPYLSLMALAEPLHTQISDPRMCVHRKVRYPCHPVFYATCIKLCPALFCSPTWFDPSPLSRRAIVLPNTADHKHNGSIFVIQSSELPCTPLPSIAAGQRFDLFGKHPFLLHNQAGLDLSCHCPHASLRLYLHPTPSCPCHLDAVDHYHSACRDDYWNNNTHCHCDNDTLPADREQSPRPIGIQVILSCMPDRTLPLLP